jgi:hypothetical protein
MRLYSLKKEEIGKEGAIVWFAAAIAIWREKNWKYKVGF